MGQQNIFEHAIIGGLLTKLNQMCEKNLTLPFPQRQFDQIEATAIESIHQAMEIGKSAGLEYIYAGNMSGNADTYCPNCDFPLILRDRILLQENRIQNSACPSCGQKIAGVW